MRAAFCGRAIALPACSSGNIVAIAVTGPPVELDAKALAPRAQALRAKTELNLAPTVGRLSRAPVDGYVL
jgi:spermidine synthase